MVTRCIDPVCERARQVSKDGAEGPPELAENTADKQALYRACKLLQHI